MIEHHSSNIVSSKLVPVSHFLSTSLLCGLFFFHMQRSPYNFTQIERGGEVRNLPNICVKKLHATLVGKIERVT